MATSTVRHSEVSAGKATPIGKALPRFRRAEEAPPCLLQPRDLMLLHDLWQHRCLTTSQIETLRGSDPDPSLRFVSRLTLTRRLKLLFHGRYLRRVARPSISGMQEPVYLLDREGARALSRVLGEASVRAPSHQPKLSALEHRLAVNQVRVSLVAARSATSSAEPAFTEQGIATISSSVRDVNAVQPLQWLGSDESKFTVEVPERKSGLQSLRKVRLLPDAFFTLKAGKLRLFYYLEVDLGSEASRILTEKCQAYYAFWRSGGFAHRFDLSPKVGFRVLFVAPTEKRLQTILGAIGKLEAGHSMFGVALQDDMRPQTILTPIWQTVKDDRGRFRLPG